MIDKAAKNIFFTALFLLSLSSFSNAIEEKVVMTPDQIEANLLPSVTTALSLGDSSNVNYLELSACDLYSKFGFGGNNDLDYSVFLLAYKGYLYMKNEGMISNDHYLTVMDFALSSNKRRLWVLDLDNNKIVFHDLVSHGRNSGEEFAHSFSNKPESFKSSLGFYVTGSPYLGKNDYSLRLHGVEEGFNDNAFERGIVIHGADYVCNKYIKNNKRLGRSQGCPAVSPKIAHTFINTIQGGSCLFIYYPEKKYLKKSEIINASDPAKEFFLNKGYALNLP